MSKRHFLFLDFRFVKCLQPSFFYWLLVVVAIKIGWDFLKFSLLIFWSIFLFLFFFSFLFSLTWEPKFKTQLLLQLTRFRLLVVVP